MVGVVRAVLVNPLPYASSDDLFWIYTDNAPYRFRLSVVDYRALEADHPAFSAVAAYQPSTVTVTDNGAPERVAGRVVSGSYFGLLGQSALLGRVFDVSDDARNEPIAGTDRRLLGSPFRQRSIGARTGDDDRRRALHDCRRAAEAGGAPGARRRAVHSRALASSETQGTLLHDGHRPAGTWRFPCHRSGDASCHEPTSLRSLEVLLSGRTGDVGNGGAESPRQRQRAVHIVLRSRSRRLRAAHRVRERGQPADRPRSEPKSRAGDSRCARRVAGVVCFSICSPRQQC